MSFQNQYNEYQQTIRALQEHMATISSQIAEHRVVRETLSKVPQDRKAWRLADTAMVETNAKDAGEVLDEKLRGLEQLQVKLEEECQGVQKEFDDWKVKNNVKIVRG
ncbi:tubulin-binding prefolding complex subunit [Pichia kluyveri]|uniref:Tubulin-binding prefolding complex subunit n=1 Tax=Pichia kluyveri TaxID=36015 RepID=A0AAV5R4Q7_PICKL|nr:tubulin-binding prefolding complex subunit [Pichia kluyveri]